MFLWLVFAIVVLGGNPDDRDEKDKSPCWNCMDCSRMVKGYDITGVTNTVVLSQGPHLRDACDCAKMCLLVNSTCSSYVWKFNGPPSRDRRVCILYSNFNLPSGVTLGFDLDTTMNGGEIENNPQGGGAVPHCLDKSQDPNSRDPDCVSGPMFVTDDGRIIC